MLRGGAWRRVLVGALIMLVGLAGCAAPSYRAPQDLAGSTPSTSGAVAQLTELLGELASGFGTTDAEAADMVDGTTTVQVAVTRLRDSLGFSDQVSATAAAWAQHWRGQVPAQDIDVAVTDAEVLGTWHHNPVARVSVQVTTSDLPGQEQTRGFEYAMSWADGALQWLGPLAHVDGMIKLDTGVGLASPTGAVQRYLDLVAGGDWAAIGRFSAGTNTNHTELKVLASVIDAARELHLVAMPIRDGEIWTVYAVTGVNHVVAQFDVDLEATTVVYSPTV